MKVAVLVLAHKNLEQLELLVSSLTSDFDVYIHIDKKWNIPLEALNDKYKNAFFFSEYGIVWGGSNIMKATISLFETAIEKSYNYYILISGQDLPLLSNKQIIHKLKGLNGASLVRYRGADRKELNRMFYYWENDTNNKLLKHIIRLTRNLQRITGIKRTLFPLRRYYKHSMWFTLHHDAVRYVLDFLHQHPDFIDKMKFTTLIDEIWLGSILLNSSEKIINGESSFVNWTTGPEYPRTLRMVDYEGVKKQDCLFARKFDMNVDKEVIYKFLNNR